MSGKPSRNSVVSHIWHTEPTETISVFKWNALINIYVDFSSYFKADGPKDILIAKTATQTKEKVDNVTNRYIKT